MRKQDQRNIEWVCASCGEKYGRHYHRESCWHVGKCDICGTVTGVTEPRDYGIKTKMQHHIGVENE
jgi:hypothetical protein